MEAHSHKVKKKRSQETAIFNMVWPTPYLYPQATSTKNIHYQR